MICKIALTSTSKMCDDGGDDEAANRPTKVKDTMELSTRWTRLTAYSGR